jgi:hypothetical protein
MTRRDAERLKVGDVVMWEGNPCDLGDVIEIGYCCVKVRWRNEPDDRNVGLMHVDDMGLVEPYEAVRS